MYYVYVLRSLKDRRLYTGSIGEFKKRIEKHNRGHEPSKKHMVPLELAYYEAFHRKYEALRREKYLKLIYGKRCLKSRLKEYLTAYSTGLAKK